LTSYATYWIAETIRVLLLIALAIIAFNFFPVTAVMIVFLAVLNDAYYDLAENPFEYRARNYALRLLVVRPGERVLELGPEPATPSPRSPPATSP
jgi:hypothetical protein